MTARAQGRLVDLEMSLLNSIRAEVATDFNPLLPEDRAHLTEAMNLVWEIEEKLQKEANKIGKVGTGFDESSELLEEF